MESQTERKPIKALSIDDAAATAGIARSTLYALVSKGLGPRLTKIGTRTVVLIADIEDWLLAQREATPPLTPAVKRRAGV